MENENKAPAPAAAASLASEKKVPETAGNPNEKRGVEGIVFKKLGEQKFYLLLHRVLNWRGWEFPKGGVEGTENPEDAMKREIKEEATLSKINVLGKLPKQKIWEAKSIKYIYDVFLVEADANERVRLSRKMVEHDDFKWCNRQQVLELLTYHNSKTTFNEAVEFLAKM